MANIKLSGSLPQQTVYTHPVSHKNMHEGERPISDSDLYGNLGNATTHVQTYKNGDKEVYLNFK